MAAFFVQNARQACPEAGFRNFIVFLTDMAPLAEAIQYRTLDKKLWKQ